MTTAYSTISNTLNAAKYYLPYYYVAPNDVCCNTDKTNSKKSNNIKEISVDFRKIIKNGPATIVFWSDGTKTVVMRKKGETDNLYHAFCAALAKRVFGSNSKVNKIVESIVDESKKNKNTSKK